MVSNHIRVYARIKKEVNGHKARYDVLSDDEGYDVMRIYNSGNSFKRKRRTFRFNKVFSPDSSQEEIFNEIAKPIIHDVFQGLNATIFAYGATGSGKTYTLTGSQTKYAERGLIPRTIEYIFRLVTNNMSNYMFFISYLEIYNENAYDLLNPKQNFTCLEELQRVIILEDEKGEAHFKNLCLKEVNTEKEAMRLLYSGDNNRTIAETPLNDYSSRSHCVFTVHVIAKCHTSGNITKSKLNLVDLAGSERLHRMNLHGMTLNEARHINLSLHYLERVIQALSHKGKNHVPYRNSMMTFILRDSLGGNCLTAMLATLSMLHLNLDESISTCKFAQRVCLITLDANVNYIPTPEKEISYLKNEVKRLKRQIGEKNFVNKQLTPEEEEDCMFTIKQFLQGQDAVLKLEDVRMVKYYFECIRAILAKQQSIELSQNKLTAKSIQDIERKYRKLIAQKDEEINALISFTEPHIDMKSLFKPISYENIILDSQMESLDRYAFQKYLNKSQLKRNYDDCINQIKAKYHEAVKISQTLTTKQKEIASIKRAICMSDVANPDLQLRLTLDQNFYREQLCKMKNIKGDIEDLKRDMSKVKLKLLEGYKAWHCSMFSKSFPALKEHKELFPISESKRCLGCRQRRNLPQGDFCEIFESSEEENPKIEQPTKEFISPNKSLSTMKNSDRTALRKVVINYHVQESGTQLPEYHKLKELSPPKCIRCKSLYSISPNCNKRSNCYKPSVNLVRSKNFLHIPSRSVTSSCDKDPKAGGLSPTCSEPSDIHSELTHLAPPKKKDLKTELGNNSSRTKENNLQLTIQQCLSADCVCNDTERKNTTPNIKISKEQSTSKFILSDDTPEFVAYLKSIPLTGDDEVDEEIIKFYRLKFKRKELKSFVLN